jgi:uncharacterized membrane protein
LTLESGRKLGFVASIMSVISPIIMGVALISLYATIIGSILSTINSGGVTPPSSLGFLGWVWGIIIVAGALSLVGYILFLISTHRLSKYYNEPTIFKNLIKALIIQIVFSIASITIVFTYLFISIGSIVPTITTTSPPAFIWNMLGIYAIVVIVGLVVSIYCAFLYKRSFYKLAEKSGVDNFRTTGLLYLIGAALQIFGVGSIVVWIGWIFAALGYRKLTPTQPTTNLIVNNQSVAPKRCSNCGTENSQDAIYCGNCGHQI